MRVVHTNGIRWPHWLRVLVGGHWFRTAGFNEVGPSYEEALDMPCALARCGRPGREHWRWCGEWMLPYREQLKLSLTRLRVAWKMRRDK